jgi:hypothetical protein
MSRTRSTGGFAISDSVVQKSYNTSNQLTGTYVWSGGGQIGSKKTIIDEVTANYARRRAAGEIILNPFTLTVQVDQHTSSGSITVGMHPNWGRQTITGDIGMVVEGTLGAATNALASDVDAHCSIAVIEAHKTMNSSAILSGEILGTIGQTVSMLRRPFRSATDLLYRTIKRRDWHLGRKSGTLLKANANAWLETRYGWRPLIGDSIEIMHMTDKVRQNVFDKNHVARGSSRGKERSLSQPITCSLFSGNYTAKGTMTRTRIDRAHAGIIFRQRRTSVATQVAQSLGLSGRSIPATVWELTPWSFVADWFVNVGPWIEASVPRPDIQVMGSWVTSISNTTLNLSGGTLTRTLSNPSATYTGSWNSVGHSVNTVKRVVNPAIPSTPVATIRPLSLQQQVDALSLSVGKISQLLRAIRH